MLRHSSRTWGKMAIGSLLPCFNESYVELTETEMQSFKLCIYSILYNMDFVVPIFLSVLRDGDVF